jgi:hypothetical protein
LVCSSDCFLYSCIFPSHVCSKNLCMFSFSCTQADSWEDIKTMLGTLSTLGNLNKTKHGKKPGSFWAQVFPRDVKSPLCLVVNLFLEQPKVNDKDSKSCDSLIKLIKTLAVNEGLHVNSFGNVGSFVLQRN